MNSDVNLTGIEQFAAMSDSVSASVVFVGPKSHFPDCLCRAMVYEVEGCSFARLGAVSDLAQIVEEGRIRPHLVVVDEALWPATPDAVLNGLRLDFRAVIAIAYRDTQRVRAILADRPDLQGQVSFLPMDLNIQSWLNIVRLMLTGYPFVPAELQAGSPKPVAISAPVPATLPASQPEQRPGRLTPREGEVLALMARGLQNKHIAEKLALSEHTVKLHVHKVISKLGAANRTDAALRFHATRSE